jgi:hypothetical protein
MTEQEKSPVICWDLDETLGHFRRISHEMQNKIPEEWEEPISTRYGIRSVLKTLGKEGYVHVVTTAGIKIYADEVVRRVGLRKHFTEVFGRESTCQGYWGKYYQCVAEKLGYSEEDMRSRAVVIGDAPGDQPMDIEGLVFIHLGGHFDARFIRPVLDRLKTEGQGNFLRGFENMYATGARIGEGVLEERRVDLYPEVAALFEYRTNSGSLGVGQKVVPTICDFRANKYRRPPIALKI